MQRRHFTSFERASEFGRFPFFLRAHNFSALESFEEFLFERGEDLIASPRFLLMLLEIVQPKRRVNADEDEQ